MGFPRIPSGDENPDYGVWGASNLGSGSGLVQIDMQAAKLPILSRFALVEQGFGEPRPTTA
jgi:hypothetical protein